MRKMKKVLSLAMTAAMTASLLTGSYSFCEEIGRWKKNEDYCFIKRYRVYRTV